MAEFNLIEEKWIPCVMDFDETFGNEELSGEIKDLSLRQVLTETNQIEEIVGENPLVTISLYRLLIAILHDCLQGPKDYDEWAEWWQSGRFDEDKLNNYFAENKSNFYLFDDKKPFYQSSLLREDGKKFPISYLFFQGEAYSTLFEHSNKECPMEISPASAARLLVSFQNFDVGGTKSSVQEVSEDGSRSHHSAQKTLLLQKAVGLVKGNNLFKTLMLNLTRYHRESEIPFTFRRGFEDLPAWRREEPTKPVNKNVYGYIDLLTWQSRQIRLFNKIDAKGNTIVDEVTVVKGHRIEDENLNKKEQMVAFQKNDKGWFALGFRENKVLWRDSFTIFANLTDSKRPRILNWINDLNKNGKLEDSIVALDFFGLTHEKAPQEGKPLFWRHERLPLPLKYLEDQELCDILREALEHSEKIAGVLWRSVDRMAILHFLPELRFEYPDWFNSNLPDFKKREAAEKFSKYRKSKEYKKKFGDADDLTKSLAPEIRYWARMETPFRRLLLALAEDFSKKNEERQKWAEELEKTALLSFCEIAFSLGNSPRSLRAVSIARNWLEAELRRKKKRYTRFEKIEDNIENQEQEEVEE